MNRCGVVVMLIACTCTARAQLRVTASAPGPLHPGALAVIAWDRGRAADSMRFAYSVDGVAWFPVVAEGRGAERAWRIPPGISGACMVRAEGVIPPSTGLTFGAETPGKWYHEYWVRLNGDGSRCLVRKSIDRAPLKYSGDRVTYQLQLWETGTGRLLNTQTTAGYYRSNIDPLWTHGMFLTYTPRFVRSDSGDLHEVWISCGLIRLWSAADGRLLLAIDSVVRLQDFDADAEWCRARMVDGREGVWHRDAATNSWTPVDPNHAVLVAAPASVPASAAGEHASGVEQERAIARGRFEAWRDSLRARVDEDELRFSPDSSRALVPDNGSAGVMLLRAGSYTPIVRVRPTRDSWIYEYTFSPDGAFAVAKLRYGLYVLLDAATGKQCARLTCPWNDYDVQAHCTDCCSDYEEFLVWDPSGRRLIIAPSFAGTPRMYPLLFDLHSGRRIRSLRGLKDMAFSSGGRFIRGTFDQDVRNDADVDESPEHLFDARTGRRVARLGAILGQFQRWDKTPGDTIAYIAGNRLVVWDVEAGRKLVSFEHPAPIESAYYLNDSRACTLDTSGALRLWNTEHGSLIRLLSTDARPGCYRGANEYYWVNVSAGYVFANRRGSGHDGVTIWDARSGRPLTPEARPIKGREPVFSGDGTAVAMCEGYGLPRVTIYHLPYADTSTVVADTVTVMIAPAAVIAPDMPAPTSHAIDSIAEGVRRAEKHDVVEERDAAAAPDVAEERDAAAAPDVGDPVAAPASGLAMTCSPNPVSDVLTVAIEAKFACTVRLSLSDMRGVEIGGFGDRSVPQGAHVVRFDVGALPTGPYLVVAEGECGRCVRMVTVMR